MEQLSIYDTIAPVPERWKCRETCRRFGENVDAPGWWNGEKRCLYPNSDTMRSVLFDNRWYTWCTMYEEKNDEVQRVHIAED